LPFFNNFPAAFGSLISEEYCRELFARVGPRRAGTPKISVWQWLMAKVYHAFAMSGSFATHAFQVTGTRVSDSALSQRGQSIGWEPFLEVLRHVLQPLADPALHAAAFYQGLRLLALDGTRMNLRNTPAMAKGAKKVRCSRGSGEPAFAHLLGVVLVELGLHQPLDAAFGWQGEGESTLARQMLAAKPLPEKSLLLGDRLFGSPWLMWTLLPLLEAASGALLLRARTGLKSKRIERYSDGSWLVELRVVPPGSKRAVGTIRVREILADIRSDTGGEPMRIRLWTSLMDAAAHPATELVELYAARWEHELFYRELKSHLHGCANLLDAQTPATAAQEAIAMLLAASLVAAQRAAVAESAGVEPLRVSFAQVREQTAALCMIFSVGEDLLGLEQRVEWTRRVLAQLAATALIQKRKPRSCQRALRQPVKDWPKMKKPTSRLLVKHIEIPNP
jgi:hypothetical protein